MADKEKLVELIKGITTNCHEIECEECQYDHLPLWNCQDYLLADYLIANGVVIREKGCPWCSEFKGIPLKGFTTHGVQKITVKFCPNCGADLRGDVNVR